MRLIEGVRLLFFWVPKVALIRGVRLFEGGAVNRIITACMYDDPITMKEMKDRVNEIKANKAYDSYVHRELYVYSIQDFFIELVQLYIHYGTGNLSYYLKNAIAYNVKTIEE